MIKTILIVDDNKPNRELLKIILKRSGYQIFEAENGEEGIRLVNDLHPDIVFMDIQLPIIDGTRALAIIKSNPITSSIPVVAFTSFAMKGDREKILKLGFSDYVAKPIKVNDVVELMARFNR